jgi:hypothetical protein
LVVVLILLVGATGDQFRRLAGLTVRLHDLRRAWALAVVLLATSLVLSPRARASVRGVPGSSLGLFVAAALAGVLLSMGPVVTWAGQPTELPHPTRCCTGTCPASTACACQRGTAC